MTLIRFYIPFVPNLVEADACCLLRRSETASTTWFFLKDEAAS